MKKIKSVVGRTGAKSFVCQRVKVTLQDIVQTRSKMQGAVLVATITGPCRCCFDRNSQLRSPLSLWQSRYFLGSLIINVDFQADLAMEEGMATHSRILAQRIPQIEKPAGYSPQGHRESDMTEATQHSTQDGIFTVLKGNL